MTVKLSSVSVVHALETAAQDAPSSRGGCLQCQYELYDCNFENTFVLTWLPQTIRIT